MAFMINMMQMNCRQCEKPLWVFIQSQEEFDNLKCDECIKANKEINELQTNETILLGQNA